MQNYNQTPQRCAIYARFSCHNQSEQSIEGQLHDCQKYAESHNYHVVATYIDRALTATSDKRPDFQRMIADSSKRTFDVVLVWKFDRFSRDRYDSAVYKNRLKKNGVRVVSAMENITDSPEGILLESMLEGYAEYFSRDLAQKVKRGMRETAKKHKVTGVIPFGYTRSEDNTYIPCPKTAPAVKKIFEMYFAGESKSDIAAYLNNHGFRTSYGNAFTKNSITPIVQNTRYIGKYKYDDLELFDEQQRIISDDLFYAVQKSVRAKQNNGAMTRAKKRFLLSGKLFCGNCNNNLHGESGKSRNGTIHYYYTCSGRKKLHICTKKRINKEQIESLVLNSIMQLFKNKNFISALSDAVMNLQYSSNKYNETIKILETQLKDVNKKISNIIDAIEQGILTPSTSERLKALEDTRLRLEYEIKNKQEDVQRFSKDEILKYCSLFNLADKITWQEQHVIIQHFINKIYLWDDRVLILYNFTNSDNTSDDDLDFNNISKKIIDEQYTCSSINISGSSSWARTSDIMINSHALCQLSYRGICYFYYPRTTQFYGSFVDVCPAN